MTLLAAANSLSLLVAALGMIIYWHGGHETFSFIRNAFMAMFCFMSLTGALEAVNAHHPPWWAVGLHMCLAISVVSLLFKPALFKAHEDRHTVPG